MSPASQLILLIGPNGSVGQALMGYLHQQSIPLKALTREMVNLTGVDASETEKARCLLSKTALPATVCADLPPLPWSHLSTGCICNGAITITTHEAVARTRWLTAASWRRRSKRERISGCRAAS